MFERAWGLRVWGSGFVFLVPGPGFRLGIYILQLENLG